MPDDGPTFRHPPAHASAGAGAASTTMAWADYGLIALMATFWGSSYFFVAVAGQALPPLTLSALRLVAASLLLLTVLRTMGIALPATVKAWWHLSLFAALNNPLPFSLIVLAQREVTGGLASIFQATSPLFALLLAPWFIASEHFTWRRLAGIAVGIIGVAILADVTAASGSGRAQLYLLGSALCYSCASIYARRNLAGLHPFAIAGGQSLAGLVQSVAGAVVLEAPWRLANPAGRVWLAGILMGMVGSALAPLCFFTVLRRAGPVNAMLSSILVPVSPILLGMIFLGEQVHSRELIGVMVIALALIIIDGRLVAHLHRRFVAAEPRP